MRRGPIGFARLGTALGAVALVLAAARADGQAVIKVNDDVNFKFGVLLQGQADWLESSTADDWQQNLFLRRMRLLVGGNIAKNVSFFFETDSPNLGKTVGGTKTGASMIVQDAFLSWKLAEEFTIDGGLILTGIAHNSLQSAASLLPIDYGAYSFDFSRPTQNVTGRDTGFQLRGYPFAKKLEYRVGVWSGQRDSASKQSFRTTARLQYNFLDADTGFFYSGTSLGKKKILAVGAGCDAQKDYKSYAADVYVDLPVGEGGAVSGQLDWIRSDGGETFTNLPKQDVIYAEGGYYLKAVKLMPFFTYGNKNVASTEAGDEDRWSVGIGYMAFGHNMNVKAAYGKIDPKNGKSVDQFTIQLQGFYF
ncbi:MAG: hypothetical protein EDX89_02100 [Acidobacteria bacterium]|nr:MAG: hypothetical protein EDX89_02100 [Acidobacteriota bacterium]MCE7956647.1 hypothetical protein [Acidobacteria bacterium ACB2]